MEYAVLKAVHVGCVATSYALFVARGVGRFTDAPWATQRWTRVAPHVVDTLLLISALAMATTLARFPAMHTFLLTKALALVTYIALGLVAFRFGRTRPVRVTAWVGAQAVFFYLVGVAITKSPTLTLLERS